MNMGIGFSEILIILVLILMFFGSKELPAFIKQAAKLIARVRHYSDKMKSELTEISKSMDITEVDVVPEVKKKKDLLRRQFISVRKDMDFQKREELSLCICDHIMNTAVYKKATAVMMYVEIGSEVNTRDAIAKMLNDGKRVIVPYCQTDKCELGIAEIKDLEKDILKGVEGTHEPRFEIRGNFLKSDLQLIVCPGVAFDMYGARLGRGKAYYDRFLRELKGRIPIYGLAYDCQVTRESLPFDYSDVPMDQIYSESGPLLPELVPAIAESSKPALTTTA